MCEIHCSDKLKLPWTAKKGKVQYWNAVVVDNAAMESTQSKSVVTPESTKGAKSSQKCKKPIKVKRILKVRVPITYSVYCCKNNTYTVLLIYNFIFTCMHLCGAMTQVSVEYVMSRVCHARNMIFHALRGTWSMRTCVTPA